MGQSFDVPPDPARIRIRIGRDKRYAHRARLEHRSAVFLSRTRPQARGQSRQSGRSSGPESFASAPTTVAASAPHIPAAKARSPFSASEQLAPADHAVRKCDCEQPHAQRRRALLQVVPRDVEAPLDDVHQLARRVGRQHRARQVGVAARDDVDRRKRRHRQRGHEQRDTTAARRLMPPGSDASTAAAAPAPSVITPPTSAPSRPAPMTTAASKQMKANRTGPMRSRLPASSAPAPSSTIDASRIASSSLPMPKKRAPKPGFGPASERTMSGEPSARSTACASRTAAAGTAGARGHRTSGPSRSASASEPDGEDRRLRRAARVERAGHQRNARQPHRGEHPQPQPLARAAEEREHERGRAATRQGLPPAPARGATSRARADRRATATSPASPVLHLHHAARPCRRARRARAGRGSWARSRWPRPSRRGAWCARSGRPVAERRGGRAAAPAGPARGARTTIVNASGRAGRAARGLPRRAACVATSSWSASSASSRAPKPRASPRSTVSTNPERSATATASSCVEPLDAHVRRPPTRVLDRLAQEPRHHVAGRVVRPLDRGLPAGDPAAREQAAATADRRHRRAWTRARPD